MFCPTCSGWVGGFQRLRESAELFEIGERIYPVIALKDLITAKEALGREKDTLNQKIRREWWFGSGRSSSV